MKTSRALLFGAFPPVGKQKVLRNKLHDTWEFTCLCALLLVAHTIFNYSSLLWPEEPEIDPPEARKALMSESQIGKAPEGFDSRMFLVIPVCLNVCCCHFFYGIWHGANGWGAEDPHCL